MKAPQTNDTPKLVPQSVAARLIGVSVTTLRSWDCPRYAIGSHPENKFRKVRYNIDEVMEWLRAHRHYQHASISGEVFDWQSPELSEEVARAIMAELAKGQVDRDEGDADDDDDDATCNKIDDGI